MLNVNDLQEMVAQANGRRKNRILSPRDVERFVSLVNSATPEQHTIRVYSSGGFVANSYKFRAEISYLQATKNEAGEFKVVAKTADAHKSYGAGSLVTINGKAV